MVVARPILRAVGLPACLGVGAVTFYTVGGHDDPYITFWPAHTLATFGHIVYYNGDRIEQSSSIIHVLLLAALDRLLPLPLPLLGYGLALLSAMASVSLAQRLTLRLRGRG
ncbi:MAG: hypothetical protein QOG64_1683, partial [Acidimicrobiaceae bacterium]|nr:hypothetical protein [Acidimicrobiaceae bacterium]